MDRLRLQLPDLSGCQPVPVVALDVAGNAEADPLTVQQPDGSIHLHAHLASVAKGEDSTLEVLSNGMTAGWMDTGGELSWQVKVFEPGSFEVTVIAVPVYGTTEVSEHHLQVAAGGSAAGGPLRGAAALNTPRSQYFPEYAVTLGRIALDAPGTHRFTLRATRVVAGTPDGRHRVRRHPAPGVALRSRHGVFGSRMVHTGGRMSLSRMFRLAAGWPTAFNGRSRTLAYESR